MVDPTKIQKHHIGHGRKMHFKHAFKSENHSTPNPDLQFSNDGIRNVPMITTIQIDSNTLVQPVEMFMKNTIQQTDLHKSSRNKSLHDKQPPKTMARFGLNDAESRCIEAGERGLNPQHLPLNWPYRYASHAKDQQCLTSSDSCNCLLLLDRRRFRVLSCLVHFVRSATLLNLEIG